MALTLNSLASYKIQDLKTVTYCGTPVRYYTTDRDRVVFVNANDFCDATLHFVSDFELVDHEYCLEAFKAVLDDNGETWFLFVIGRNDYYYDYSYLDFGIRAGHDSFIAYGDHNIDAVTMPDGSLKFTFESLSAAHLVCNWSDIPENVRSYRKDCLYSDTRTLIDPSFLNFLPDVDSAKCCSEVRYCDTAKESCKLFKLSDLEVALDERFRNKSQHYGDWVVAKEHHNFEIVEINNGEFWCYVDLTSSEFCEQGAKFNTFAATILEYEAKLKSLNIIFDGAKGCKEQLACFDFHGTSDSLNPAALYLIICLRDYNKDTTDGYLGAAFLKKCIEHPHSCAAKAVKFLRKFGVLPSKIEEYLRSNTLAC